MKSKKKLNGFYIKINKLINAWKKIIIIWNEKYSFQTNIQHKSHKKYARIKY
jgi:hypothetical protein